MITFRNKHALSPLMEESATTAPAREEVYLTSGRWASDDNPVDEQIEAAERIQKYVSVGDAPDYEEPTETFNTKVATVRGFWTEDEPDKQSDIAVFVLLDIEGEPTTIRFPIYKNRDKDMHTETFKRFLRTAGVTTENIPDIVGRKLLVKDSSALKSNDGLTFCNHRHAALHVPVLLAVGMGSLVISVISLFSGRWWMALVAGANFILLLPLLFLLDFVNDSISVEVSNYQIE